MEEVNQLKDELKKKLDYVNELIDNCEVLKTEWEKRIQEAEQARDNFRELFNYLKSEKE